MTRINRMSATMVLAAMLAAGMLLPFTARASEDGRRNTTYALGALTGVLATQKMWVPAAVAGVGTVVAYKQYTNDIAARHRRERAARLAQARYARQRNYSGRVVKLHHKRHRRHHHKS